MQANSSNSEITMQETLRTLFSYSLAEASQPKPAKRAQTFLSIRRLQHRFYLEPITFGTRTPTWNTQEQSCMLVWLCFTWLKAIRYKGTHSLNPFWTPGSCLKMERHPYSRSFATYDLRVSGRCACVYTYERWGACVCFDHMYAPTPFPLPQELSGRILENIPLDLSFGAKRLAGAG